MIAETRNYIVHGFWLSSTSSLLKLSPKRLFINDISSNIFTYLAIFLLIFSNSSTSQKDKYVLLHFLKLLLLLLFF